MNTWTDNFVRSEDGAIGAVKRGCLSCYEETDSVI
jgi:hypothetical protein